MPVGERFGKISHRLGCHPWRVLAEQHVPRIMMIQPILTAIRRESCQLSQNGNRGKGNRGVHAWKSKGQMTTLSLNLAREVGGGGGSHRPFLKAEIAGNLLVAVLHLDAFHSCSSELQSRRLLYNSWLERSFCHEGTCTPQFFQILRIRSRVAL